MTAPTPLQLRYFSLHFTNRLVSEFQLRIWTGTVTPNVCPLRWGKIKHQLEGSTAISISLLPSRGKKCLQNTCIFMSQKI